MESRPPTPAPITTTLHLSHAHKPTGLHRDVGTMVAHYHPKCHCLTAAKRRENVLGSSLFRQYDAIVKLFAYDCNLDNLPLSRNRVLSYSYAPDASSRWKKNYRFMAGERRSGVLNITLNTNKAVSHLKSKPDQVSLVSARYFLHNRNRSYDSLSIKMKITIN